MGARRLCLFFPALPIAQHTCVTTSISKGCFYGHNYLLSMPLYPNQHSGYPWFQSPSSVPYDQERHKKAEVREPIFS